MSHFQKYLREALAVSLFCLVALGVVSSASAVSPANVPFNDPVIWWPSEYWDTTELPVAWATTLGSPAITVAVVDSGVKPISDLAPNMVSGHNSWNGSSNTSDKFGHGTMMASVIGAVANNDIGVIGVCPLCKVMPVRAYGTGKNVSYGSLASGIRWAVNHRARVINVSFSAASDESSEDFDKAVSYATSKGSLVVIAAGNGTDSNEIGTNNPTANSLASDNPEAIRVADAESPDNGLTIRLDPMSNYGKRLADVAAFGTYVPVDSIDYDTPIGVSGTSISAAVVSGTAGLLLSIHPELTPAQLKTIIMSSCNHIGLKVPCEGVVSANRALIAAQNPPTSVYMHVKIGGRGKVTVSGQAACTTNCRYVLVTGAVRLSATSSNKRLWYFDHWTGGISSRRAKLSINMKAAKSIKAVFVKTKNKRR